MEREFGYDRDNAAIIYEYQQYKGRQILFNTLVGGACAMKFAPVQREAALSHPLFRKPWMAIPIKLTVFMTAYYCSQ